MYFAAVGKAFGVLSDTEKRRRYDVYGSEAEHAPSPHRHGGRHSHNGHHHYEFDGNGNKEIDDYLYVESI